MESSEELLAAAEKLLIGKESLTYSNARNGSEPPESVVTSLGARSEGGQHHEDKSQY
jgi:hypothetical protein